MNNLNTILDQAGARGLVQEYLDTRFLERKEYDTPLANSQFAMKFRLAGESGQYVTAKRKGRLRRPQNLSLSTPEADPASGALFALEKRTLPLEAIHEYIPIGTFAAWTSIVDLEEWANEDLIVSLKRRLHELTQNAFKVGRYLPGKWAANGTAATAFDTTVEATMSAHGLSFVFEPAPAYFANGKTSFASMNTNDRVGFRDLERMFVRLDRAGAPKIDGCYVCSLSSSTRSDLMNDDRYFKTVVEAWKGEGIRENTIAKYRGWWFQEDDDPMTEDWGAPLVRASNGPVHTTICFGKSAFAYLELGKQAPRGARPKFKVQDVSLTGTEKTIGYMVPFQTGIVNPAWCATLTGPVSEYLPNNG